MAQFISKAAPIFAQQGQERLHTATSEPPEALASGETAATLGSTSAVTGTIYDEDGTGTIDVVRARPGALSTARAACARARDPASARLGRRARRASP